MFDPIGKNIFNVIDNTKKNKNKNKKEIIHAQHKRHKNGTGVNFVTYWFFISNILTLYSFVSLVETYTI